MDLLKALFTGSELENKVVYKRLQMITISLAGLTPLIDQSTVITHSITGLIQALLTLSSVILTVATTKTLGLSK